MTRLRLSPPVALLLTLSAFGCAGAPGAATSGPAKLELSSVTVTELDGNGDDAPNRGETLYLKPVFKNAGQGPSGEFKVKMTVAEPGSTHTRGIGTDQITVASLAAGAASDRQSNYMLGLKLDKTATPGATVPVKLTATLAGGATQIFEHPVVVAPIANAFTLAGTTIAEANTTGDGKLGPGEVLYLKPRFTNTGAAKTNQLTVVLNASGTASPYVGGEAASFISIGALPAGETSATPSKEFLGVKIAATAAPGAAIPISYTLKDPFGNQWEVADTLTLAP